MLGDISQLLGQGILLLLPSPDAIENGVVNFFVNYIDEIFLFGLLVFLGKKFANKWLGYVQKEYIDSLDWVVLHISIPQEVHKSPAAMELILHALHQTGGTGDWISRWWNGKVRDWFSLEIVSVEGSVYFFIRTQRKYVDYISAQFYAQYPGIYISETDDYTRYVPPYKANATPNWSMFGAELKLSAADAFPIKTYIDYGMDKELSLKEEQRIDPMTPMLEFLGTLRKGEQMWIQINMRAATKRYSDPSAKWYEIRRRDWVTVAKDEIKKYLEGFQKEDGTRDLGNMTTGERRVLEGLERSITKLGFDAGIRMIYLAHEDKFRGTNIGPMLNSFKQYNSPGLNGFKPTNTTGVSHAWEDIMGKKVEKKKQKMFDAYVRRSYFHAPYQRSDVFIFTTEELATIFHLPARNVVTSPSIERIESRTAEPPMDLPI